MAFGNPYEEPWGPEIVEDALIWLKDIGVRTVSLADTMGTVPAPYVGALYSALKDRVAGVELGVHLHSRPEDAAEKVLAAYDAGCRRFDGALTGLGDCPFAGDALVGNIATETLLSALATRDVETGIRVDGLESVIALTQQIRAKYGQETSS
jgi:hydroxymethylglutaryl-CoA lyase